MRLQIQYASPFGNCASIVSKEIISLCNKYIYKNSGIYSVTNKVGVSASGICQCCKGEKEYAKGYKWMYEDEYKKL